MAEHIDPDKAYFDIAHEGAQLRAVADALPWESILSDAPRSIVVLAGDELSYRAAQAVLGVCQPLATPVVITQSLPSYVGALDVVLLLSESGAHDGLAQAASVCHARGTTTIAAIGHGRLREDLPSSTHIIDPLPMHEGPSPARSGAALLALLVAQPTRRLHAIAERVDEELLRCAPERETLNPARDIAQKAAFGLHVANDAESLDLCALVACMFNQHAKLSGSIDGRALGAFYAAQPPRDPFHDPIIDGPLPPEPAIIRWAVAELAEAEGDRATALFTLMARAFAATMY
ncbi:hypothetical protein [Corynebacterium pseudopelargi]|uniref:Bifunctional glucose-6-phosphate/mannose-6-phosphate isomerase C-terminal domain-containing protein n=1 Tax=Corynebacterium pseudopelargi TaxID=2080757 RepID=A0A3G6IVK5_9CORY|nr:hypothetical protein [Corynebacterium pseudopelargi]AZA09829.1 hypothetical protein CPPEL_08630 [Corynebacterium pseudopelargi]